MTTILVLGRVIFGLFFLWNAYKHFTQWAGMAQYAASKGVKHAKYAILGSGILLLIGGFSFLLDVREALGALAIILFLIPVTFTMHQFWKESGEHRQMQEIQFGKNMALLGAALMLFVLYR